MLGFSCGKSPGRAALVLTPRAFSPLVSRWRLTRGPSAETDKARAVPRSAGERGRRLAALRSSSPRSLYGTSKKEMTTPMSGTTATSKSAQQTMEIKLAHSPDSDDAFMFYALATHKLATPGYKYTHVLADIQTLNDAALTETYDVTAVSFAAYPFLRDKYVLLDCGASFGESYGPIVVSTKAMRPQELAGKRIGVPGLRTTAYLTMKLFEPNFEAVVMPFDKILDAVQAETVDAGLLIHEGQLLFPQLGMHRVIDLGIWWHDRTKLPLPLAATPYAGRWAPNLGSKSTKRFAIASNTALGTAKKR